MKSPFTDPVIVVPDDGNGYAFAEDNEEEPRPLTLEEITFAAHAINQYDKLVEILDTYRAMHQVDGIGGQMWDCVTYTRLLDKLNILKADLLKEETTWAETESVAEFVVDLRKRRRHEPQR